MTGRDPSGQALAVPATPANAVDGPLGFDPSRSEWATPSFREAERRILLAMYGGVGPDFGFFPFKSIARLSGVPLDLVRPLVHRLATTGGAHFMRGLMDEDGGTVGSGYGLTEKGRERAHAIATETRRAETGDTDSVEDEGAGRQALPKGHRA